MIPFITKLSDWKIFKPDINLNFQDILGGQTEKLLGLALLSRNIDSRAKAFDFMASDLEDMASPFLMKNMEKAADLFLEAEKKVGKIRIFGDYDADGVTAVACLVKFIRKLGLSVDYFIPNRLENGYGISAEGVDSASEAGISLAIAVDCGISDIFQIERLKERGIKTIILDHHTLPPFLPKADAIVNPMDPECGYHNKPMAGVGVAFKFIQAVSEKKDLPFPYEYLIPAAIGSIGDLMPLLHENRIIVKNAIDLFKDVRKTWPGIFVILQSLSLKDITPKTIGFSICPKLNAPGRIGDASCAVNLLLSDNVEQAEKYYDTLLILNKKRQKIEEKMRKAILFRLQDSPDIKERKVLVEYGEDCHAGVLGITAAKLVDTFNMPVFLIALKNGIGRGSARAAAGYNIYKMLEENQDLLDAYGGHAQAGGFSIKEENIPLLRERLKDAQPDDFFEDSNKYQCAGKVDFSDLTEESIEQLEQLRPFGKDNERPFFYFDSVEFMNMTKAAKNTLIATLRQDDSRFKGIAFGQFACASLLKPDVFKYGIIASPYINEYNGIKTVELEISSVIMHSDQADLSFGGKQSDCRGAPGNPALIDAGNISPRIKYLKKTAESSKCAALVRTQKQIDALNAALGDEYSDNVSILLIRNIEKSEDCEDLIFFHPPPSFSFFRNKPCCQAKRLHFLFGHNEIECERQFFKNAVPDLLSVFKTAELLENCPLPLNYEKKIAWIADKTKLGHVKIKLILSFLREKSIYVNHERYSKSRFDITENEIVSSKTFAAFKRQFEEFNEIAEVYSDSFENFSKVILSQIRRYAEDSFGACEAI